MLDTFFFFHETFFHNADKAGFAPTCHQEKHRRNWWLSSIISVQVTVTVSQHAEMAETVQKSVISCYLSRGFRRRAAGPESILSNGTI